MLVSLVGIWSSQWQWLKSSLLRPYFSEPNRSAARLVFRRSRIAAPLQGKLQGAIADCGRSHHECAVGDGLGDRFEFFCALEDRRRTHGGPRLAKSHGIRIHQPEAMHSEISHGARRCADVQRIARVHQHHDQIIQIRSGRQGFSFYCTARPHKLAINSWQQNGFTRVCLCWCSASNRLTFVYRRFPL